MPFPPISEFFSRFSVLIYSEPAVSARVFDSRESLIVFCTRNLSFELDRKSNRSELGRNLLGRRP